MRFRRFWVVLMVLGTGLMAGCPFDPGFLEGLIADAIFQGGVIEDGTYSGTSRLTSEGWLAGERQWNDTDGDEASAVATFAEGKLVAPSGYWVEVGDTDELYIWETLQLSRGVYSVDFGDWGYEIAYDVEGEWKNVPLEGTQVVTYWTTAAGTLSMYDTIELTSLESYEGPEWEIVIEAEGTLVPAEDSQPPSEDPLDDDDDDILDRKSG